MTVSSVNTKNSYSANGSLTSFTYTFPINSSAELKVIERSANGTETIKSLTSHYSITDNGSQGGQVNFNSAPANGVTVVLLRDTTLTQETDYIANDPFGAETHEAALDKLTLQQQELQEELDRSIKLSRTNTMSSTEFTVGSTDRSGKILGFDTNGELVVSQELGSFKGNWSASTSYAARDIVKDTSTNNIFLCNQGHTSSGTQPLTTNTDSGKWDLLVDAASATTAQTAAAASATAAATSKTNAATSATASASSATASASSASTASTKASEASTSASNASTSQTNAASSATSAASSTTTATTKASEASTSATNAASSATAAASSATTATTKASEASTSASNAASSASTASTQATNAASSATTATTKATEAASSATAAANSATAAANSADAFDDVYLGTKSSNPTQDNDGDSLAEGMIYFNSTTNRLKFYDGSAWNNVEATDTSSFATKGFATAMSIAL